jgi:hypothetical protein
MLAGMSFDAASGAPLSPLQRDALAYWERKRGARQMPARRDLDPTEIPHLLANVVLAEVLAGEAVDFRFRVVGDAIRSRAHENIAGRRISEIAHMRDGMLRCHYETVAATGRPFASRIEYVGPDRLVRAAAHLLLPLGAEAGRVDMVFGVVEFALDR